MTASLQVPAGPAGPVPPVVAPVVAPVAAPVVAPAAERPSWLPEKFGSAEDMAKAYAALEAKQGAAPAADPAAAAAAAAAAPTTETVAALAAKAEIDIAPFQDEFDEKGALSPESYAKLAAAGMSKAFVDSYIAGQQAIAAQVQGEVHALVGGAEAFGALMGWAKTGLTAAEKDAFNAQIDKASPAAAKLLVQGLHAKYTAATGKTPTLVGGQPGTQAGFASLEQYKAAIRDPRYAKDEAYRNEVTAKAGRSAIW